MTIAPALAALALPSVRCPAPILVLEADATVAALVQVVLAEAGFVTHCLAPWDDARVLRTLAARHPAAVLLNSHASAAAGSVWVRAQRLHAQNPALPLVLFTADAQAAAEAEDGTSARSRAARFAAVVRKPFELDELVATIRRVVGPR
jgi:DNA-binding response OmpR family regulator